jgi:adenosine kinase
MNFSGRYSDHIRPESLSSLSVSIFIDRLQDAHGGIACNIAYSLALLGEEPVMVGSVGKDGLLFMEKLAHAGVNITHVYESELPTATFTVLTDADQNQVGGFYPGAMFDSDTQTFEPWKDQNPIVVVSAHDPKAMKRHVEECRKWKLRLFYDVGQQVTNLPGEDMRAAVEVAEVLALNEYEMGVFSQKTGLSVEEIKAKVPVVITTLGKEGSMIEGAKVPKPIKVGIAKPKEVVDPTGAGDAFRAGFLYGYARDWPLGSCAQLGAVCASYAIEITGTQAHSFTVEEVTRRYYQNFNEHLPKII